MTLRTALVAFGTLFATTAFASDITLAPGFTPDPMNMTITSGGTTAASTWQSNCAGWVADRQSPDIKLTWTGAGTLHISATSSADVTLVVNDANGNWHCNDDQSGTNPGLTINSAAAGLVEVWIGSYESGAYAQTNVQISEIGQFQ
ncbi:MAG: hypothetical protein ACJAZO_003720 [Myxococcota bacterium]|jgi:hypothetical protein